MYTIQCIGLFIKSIKQTIWILDSMLVHVYECNIIFSTTPVIIMSAKINMVYIQM